MRQSTHKSLCRLSFVLFCLFPTLLVAGWILVLHTPVYQRAYKASWEKRLTQETGLLVEIESVSHPYHGAVLLRGVRFTDRETEKEIATIRVVEAALLALTELPAPALDGEESAAAPSVQTAGSQLVIRLSQPEIGAEHLQRVWEIVEHRLLRGQTSLTAPTFVYASEWTLGGKSVSRTYLDVGCEFRTSQSERSLAIEFHLAANDSANNSTNEATVKDASDDVVTTPRIRLAVVRHLNEEQPVTRFQADTNGAAFSLATLTNDKQRWRRLGPRCRFQGVLWAEQTPEGWEGEASGRLLEIDLDRLVSDQFPHKLSGQADIVLTRAELRGGKLVEASGEFEGRDGVVGAALLESIEKWLYLTMSPTVSQYRHSRFPYHRLKFGFKVNESGLALVGRCPESPGAILTTANDEVLLSDSGAQLRPLVGLIRALAPESEIQAPATQETTALLSIFSAPPLAPPRDQIARPPDSHLRLRDAPNKR